MKHDGVRGGSACLVKGLLEIRECVISTGQRGVKYTVEMWEIKKVILAFTPNDSTGYDKSEVVEENTHLFVRGKFFDETGEDEFMFQAITHA